MKTKTQTPIIETPLVAPVVAMAEISERKAANRKASRAKAATAPVAPVAPVETPAETPAKAPVAPKLKGDGDAAHAKIRALVATESARRLCLCGCGAQTPKAFFVPGHDAKLLSTLLKADVERQKAALAA